MTITIDRNFLEIKSIDDLSESKKPKYNHAIEKVDPVDFQLNKFFYKNIGKKHRWTDRLIWSENDWVKYVSSPKVETYTLKIDNDLAGYFELINHANSQEIEIAYFGLLEEYHNKKLGISTEVGKGYRALANIRDDGGQEVPHLHFHLFGGEKVGKMVE